MRLNGGAPLDAARAEMVKAAASKIFDAALDAEAQTPGPAGKKRADALRYQAVQLLDSLQNDGTARFTPTQMQTLFETISPAPTRQRTAAVSASLIRPQNTLQSQPADIPTKSPTISLPEAALRPPIPPAASLRTPVVASSPQAESPSLAPEGLSLAQTLVNPRALLNALAIVQFLGPPRALSD